MITVNELDYEYKEGLSLFELKKEVKPEADIVIYNGFPVDEDVALCDGDAVIFIKRNEVPSKDELEHLMCARHTPGVHAKLKKASVGIAGVGGLGSAVAVALARVGIGRLVIADYDVVEPSNLNRQQYYVDQLGQVKVEALHDNLRRINPYIEIVKHNIKLTSDNIFAIFKDVGVLVEAFDKPDTKAMLVNTMFARNPKSYVVAASGLGGYGNSNLISVRNFGKGLFVVGDGYSAARPGMGLMAPRVGVAAHHQANKVLEIILENKGDD